MNQSTVTKRIVNASCLMSLYVLSGVTSAQDTNNPWLEPRVVGPADVRTQGAEKNTWSETEAAESNGPDSSMFPPMDEDTALGIEPYAVPPVVTEAPVANVPPTGDETGTYPPATGSYGQAPGNYGYGNYQYYGSPYSGYNRPYQGYSGSGYRGYGPGNYGNMWPGGSGGMWPGSGGFPFGGSGWMPF